ncbi:hypothetical protein EMPS_03697 [Entomortierella parvispora]|uniref:Uncharacterized protein n=1 Tax=Entomortierella parvispora TaxID=205924 RepID=A0A9P3LUU5_9FUNG|nr:hypothetical protein EMPS_03697 [Entomortierella parvispora]
MVTTRSRVSKQAGGQPRQDVVNAQSAAAPTLKRKSTVSSTSAGSSATPTKIPRTTLESDLLAEAQLPQTPAPTPTILNDASNAKELQANPFFGSSNSDSTGHINNGNGDKNSLNISKPEMPLTAAPSAPPLAPTASLPEEGGDKQRLEAVKEPAPEPTSMMPEVTTILTGPVTDQLIESLVTNSAPLSAPPPPAPTAPEVSSVSAVAPLVTNPQEVSSTHTVAGATTAPVLPAIPTDSLFTPLVPTAATATTNATSLPNYNGNNYTEQPANGPLSSTLVGIDAATANAAHAQAQAQAQAQDSSQAAQVVGSVGTNKLEEQQISGQAFDNKTDHGPTTGATTTVSTTV